MRGGRRAHVVATLSVDQETQGLAAMAETAAADARMDSELVAVDERHAEGWAVGGKAGCDLFGDRAGW
jgi:hypothetical protein